MPKILKVYLQARTAHLERVSTSGPEQVLFYVEESYDFHSDDENSTRSIRKGYIGILLGVLLSSARIIEINEPLYLRSLPIILVVRLSTFIKRFLLRQQVSIVAYAIENTNPIANLQFRLGVDEGTAKRILTAAMMVACPRYDRVAFGTADSLACYEAYFPAMQKIGDKRVVPPLEPACKSCDLKSAPNTVVFLGSFEQRKGILKLLDAWKEVAENAPDAQLTIMGKGPLLDQVETHAALYPSVDVIIDPPRKRIHEVLSKSKLLVLLSQSTPIWSEQIGLPIIEGLSHGCMIATTDCTGISIWLQKSGHTILPETASRSEIAKGLISALAKDISKADIVRSLPEVSGRYQAELWLCGQ